MAVNIIDVSNVVCVGHFRFKNNFTVSTANGDAIPTGGLYNLLRMLQLRKYNFTQDLWLFCFDRHSTRKEKATMSGIDYKGGRDGMPPEVILQLNAAEYWLRKSGFNVFAFDGYESDDIVATLAMMCKPLDVQVNIISTDRDSAFLVDKNTTLVSPNTNVPSVTIDNYKDVAGKRGHRVHYNTSLLYKTLCGDSSDKIPSVKRNAYALYNKITLELYNLGVPYESLSDVKVVEELIGYLDGDIGRRAKENWELVKPDFIPEEWLEIKNQDLNYEELSNFLHLFGMKGLLRKFGLPVLNPLPEFCVKERIRMFDGLTELYSGGYFSYEEDRPMTIEPYEDYPEVGVLENIEDIEQTNKEVEEVFKGIKNLQDDSETSGVGSTSNTEESVKVISEDYKVRD